MLPGLRVVRAAQWQHGIIDGGEGNVGTLDISYTDSGEAEVSVFWDVGKRQTLERRANRKYDVLIYDSGPTGVRPVALKCGVCAALDDIYGMTWQCAECNTVICTPCYMNMKDGTLCHDHEFLRLDFSFSAGVSIPPRAVSVRKSERLTARGIGKEAEVQRGPNWRWGEQDVGKVGIVQELINYERIAGARNAVKVKWSGSDVVSDYRLGINGKVDLQTIRSADLGFYFPGHLPQLGVAPYVPIPKDDVAEFKQLLQLALPPPVRFHDGDLVQLTSAPEQMKLVQRYAPDCGGWNDPMAECSYELGSVHRITANGNIRVQFHSNMGRWTFCARLCTLRFTPPEHNKPILFVDKVVRKLELRDEVSIIEPENVNLFQKACFGIVDPLTMEYLKVSDRQQAIVRMFHVYENYPAEVTVELTDLGKCVTIHSECIKGFVTDAALQDSLRRCRLVVGGWLEQRNEDTHPEREAHPGGVVVSLQATTSHHVPTAVTSVLNNNQQTTSVVATTLSFNMTGVSSNAQNSTAQMATTVLGPSLGTTTTTGPGPTALNFPTTSAINALNSYFPQPQSVSSGMPVVASLGSYQNGPVQSGEHVINGVPTTNSSRRIVESVVNNAAVRRRGQNVSYLRPTVSVGGGYGVPFNQQQQSAQMTHQPLILAAVSQYPAQVVTAGPHTSTAGPYSASSGGVAGLQDQLGQMSLQNSVDAALVVQTQSSMAFAYHQSPMIPPMQQPPSCQPLSYGSAPVNNANINASLYPFTSTTATPASTNVAQFAGTYQNPIDYYAQNATSIAAMPHGAGGLMTGFHQSMMRQYPQHVAPHMPPPLPSVAQFPYLAGGPGVPQTFYPPHPHLQQPQPYAGPAPPARTTDLKIVPPTAPRRTITPVPGASVATNNNSLPHDSQAKLRSIMLAIEQNNLAGVELLKQFPAMIDQISTYNEHTPLSYAILKGRIDIVKMLLSFGASAASLAPLGTALHMTVLSEAQPEQSLVIAKCLLALPVDRLDVNRQDRNGKTVAHLAIERQRFDILDLLFSQEHQHRVDTQIVDSSGQHLLHVVVALRGDDNLFCRATAVLQYAPELIDSLGNLGETALHQSLLYGLPTIFEVLLNMGADVSARNSNGATPLHYAVDAANAECVQILVNRGASVDAKDNEGNTPLLKALISLLDLEHSGALGVTEQHCSALYNIEIDIANPNALDIKDLVRACRSKLLAIVCFLVLRRSNVSLENSQGIKPMNKIKELKDRNPHINNAVKSFFARSHGYCVCARNVAGTRFMPCGCVVLCTECCSSFPTLLCPRCNRRIERKIDIMTQKDCPQLPAVGAAVVPPPPPQPQFTSEEQFSCAICLEGASTPLVSLACGHVFHDVCANQIQAVEISAPCTVCGDAGVFNQQLKKKTLKLCPTCRRHICTGTTRPVYL